jgi:hypothetical protein
MKTSTKGSAKVKGDKEMLSITFKGLLSVFTQFDEAATQRILDGLELYLRRNHMIDPGEYGAIIYTGKDWVISSVQQEEAK